MCIRQLRLLFRRVSSTNRSQWMLIAMFENHFTAAKVAGPSHGSYLEHGVMVYSVILFNHFVLGKIRFLCCSRSCNIIILICNIQFHGQCFCWCLVSLCAAISVMNTMMDKLQSRISTVTTTVFLIWLLKYVFSTVHMLLKIDWQGTSSDFRSCVSEISSHWTDYTLKRTETHRTQ